MIKVGFCVSYDWEMLKTSLPRVYKDADKICLGLDKDRHAWSCKPFDFDEEAFYHFVKAIDEDHKIDIYEEDFSISNLNSRENCNRHRSLIADRLGKGGWHIQIDADEYFLDFPGFVSYLNKLNKHPKPEQKAINICCPFIPLIKKVSGGYLYVDFENRNPEIIPMATNRPDYQRARQNGHFNHISPFYVIHETWARSDKELWYKINNWGHASEELTAQQSRLSYYNLWKSLDAFNFKYIRNFNPSKGEIWPGLNFIPATSIEELIQNFPVQKLPFNAFGHFLSNNRNIARIRTVFRKIAEQ